MIQDLHELAGLLQSIALSLAEPCTHKSNRRKVSLTETELIGVTPFDRYGFVGCLKHLNINGAPRDVVQLAHQQDVGKSPSCDGFWI